MSNAPEIQLKNRFVAGLLAWLVPGLGHLYQGRTGKAVLFAVCIHGLFWTGYAMGDWKVVWLRWDAQEVSWPYFAQLGMGLASLPALANDREERAWLPEPLKSFQLPPSEEVLDELHNRRGKLMDVALVYTIIAGLLNVFVIYDAVSGPAMREEEQREIERRRKAHAPRPATG
jgi:hypothetical protein